MTPAINNRIPPAHATNVTGFLPADRVRLVVLQTGFVLKSVSERLTLTLSAVLDETIEPLYLLKRYRVNLWSTEGRSLLRDPLARNPLRGFPALSFKPLRGL